MKNIFSETTKKDLQLLYDDYIKAKEEGLRPRSFDKYISVIQENFPLSFGEAWKYSETQFFEEVAKRYFYE